MKAFKEPVKLVNDTSDLKSVISCPIYNEDDKNPIPLGLVLVANKHFPDTLKLENFTDSDVQLL